MTKIFIVTIDEFYTDSFGIKHYEIANMDIFFDHSHINEYKKIASYLKENKQLLYPDYEINIYVIEGILPRRKYHYPAGLIKYFNDVINSDNNIYEKILNCVDYIVYRYNGDTVKSTVILNQPVNSFVSFADWPLFEKDCDNGYHSNFKILSSLDKTENHDYYIIDKWYVYNIYFETAEDKWFTTRFSSESFNANEIIKEVLDKEIDKNNITKIEVFEISEGLINKTNYSKEGE